MWSSLRADDDDDPKREPWTVSDVNVWSLVGVVTLGYVVGIGTSLLVRVL